jgi:hypothetical protein
VTLGREIDAVASKAVNEHLAVLTKFAYFDGKGSVYKDRFRVWLQATLEF